VTIGMRVIRPTPDKRTRQITEPSVIRRETSRCAGRPERVRWAPIQRDIDSTRVGSNYYSYVRLVAELSDGRYMAVKTFVKP